MNLLIAYATRCRATRGVADRIAVGLRRTDLTVTLTGLPAAIDPAAYDAVLIGSAVYLEAWLPPAVEFARDYVDTLVRKQVWTFSVGMLRNQGGLVRWIKWTDAKNMPEIDGPIKARGHRYFAGKLEPIPLPTFHRVIFRMAGGCFGDFRDWSAIDRWTAAVAAADRAVFGAVDQTR